MILHRLIILTPYSGSKKILMKTINSTINQLNKNDLWIIILDNQDINKFIYLEKEYHQITLLNYNGPKGAGNSRNIGLDYLIKNIKGEFLLLPLDGDDELVDNGLSLIKKKMSDNSSNVISFGHQKIWPDGTKRTVAYSGIFYLNDLLKKYITPCGSTIIKISNSKLLKDLRFSNRYRANDELFFLLAIRYFGQFKCYPNVLLKYKTGNFNSLSGKKYKMIFYKFMVFKDFGLNNIYSMFYTLYYIYNGIRRYLFKHSI